MPFVKSKVICHYLVHKWQEISKTITQYFLDFVYSIYNKCKKKCQSPDKNGLGEYLTINRRYFLLVYNLFWQSSDFLDIFGPSRSVCVVRRRGIPYHFEGKALLKLSFAFQFIAARFSFSTLFFHFYEWFRKYFLIL